MFHVGGKKNESRFSYVLVWLSFLDDPVYRTADYIHDWWTGLKNREGLVWPGGHTLLTYSSCAPITKWVVTIISCMSVLHIGCRYTQLIKLTVECHC